MKVLVTGGYGFIGSHVVERFHKEGHEVFILDNLSTGRKENITFKHKGYIVSIEDNKCEEIFRSNKFDIVVHLAAQASVSYSIKNPTLDTESNVLGFVNMLNLAHKFGVKRFIYASSAAVYGEQKLLPITEDTTIKPVSPYGISKWMGEQYSQKWEELYDLQTVGFRFANVYGPRQSSDGEGGVISIFIDRLLKGQQIIIHGDGEQTRDFIYVEDVADAIYRSANSINTGIFNLSSNQSTSINELIHYLSSEQPPHAIIHSEERAGDIKHSLLDHSKITREFDWSPMYSIEEGLQRTLAYTLNDIANQQTAAAVIDAPKRLQFFKSDIFKKFLPTLENLLAFILVTWLTLSYSHSAYGFIDVKLFYITIMGILYGNRQAILAVALSGGLFVYQKLLDGRDAISLTYDTDFFFQIAIYIFIGLVVGYTVERKNMQINDQAQKLAEVNERYMFLDHVYNEVREVKDELQLRILNSGDSYGKIYHATKELESLEPTLVFNAAVNVVKSIMNAPRVSIYAVNQNQSYLRLIASSGYQQENLAKSIKVADHSYLHELMNNGSMHINRELQDKVPLMSAPIFHKDRIATVISIDGLSFENFSLYHQNLFRITVDLISSALTKAFVYIDATENKRFFKDTTILQSHVFGEIYESKKQAYFQHNIPYMLIKVDMTNVVLEEASEFIASKLRETDYLGLGNNDEVYILLTNTSLEDSNHVIHRLSHEKLQYEIIREE